MDPNDSSFIDIQSKKKKGRDIIGYEVSGSGNIIGKDINIIINQAQSYGLTLLHPNYFIDHKSTL